VLTSTIFEARLRKNCEPLKNFLHTDCCLTESSRRWEPEGKPPLQGDRGKRRCGERGRCSEAVACRTARGPRVVSARPFANFGGLRPRATSDSLWRRHVALHGSHGRVSLRRSSTAGRRSTAKGLLPRTVAGR